MTAKERYKKAGFKIDVKPNSTPDNKILSYSPYFGGLRFTGFNTTKKECWQWVEDNFPLPDIEAIKKKWQKELDEFDETAGYDKNDTIEFIKEFLADLQGEK